MTWGVDFKCLTKMYTYHKKTTMPATSETLAITATAATTARAVVVAWVSGRPTIPTDYQYSDWLKKGFKHPVLRHLAIMMGGGGGGDKSLSQN